MMLLSRHKAFLLRRITFAPALLLALFLSLLPLEAEAALSFCNRTQQPIEAAFGHREHSDDDDNTADTWISEGWWRIDPGQCSRVFAQPLKERFYFYYAISLFPSAPDKPPFVWQGKYQFCTDNKAFKIEGDGDCDGRGFRARGYQQVDVGVNTRDYSLDFRNGE